MKPINVRPSSYIKFEVENNDKDSKFDFVVENIKVSVTGKHVIQDLNSEKIFYGKKSQKTHQTEFRAERVIKKKDNKLYANWKDCNNSFYSWIGKKRYRCITKWKNQIKFELDLPNYTTKSDLKGTTGIDNSKFT